MEYLKGKEDAGLDICRVMNVPPEMVGFSSSKTYSNYQTARRALYTEAVFPILELIVNELNHWLLPVYDDRLVLGIDRDAVDAIREERVALFDKLNNAWWLTINRRLALAGLPDYGPEGEVLLIPNNLTPLYLTPQTTASAPELEHKLVIVPGGGNGHKVATNGVPHG
jgi:phage portal protein BeeE